MSDYLAIRPVTRLDYEQWLPLWDGYNAFYGRAGETALHPDITRMTWSRFFDAYEPMHALVAESEGRLIGLTHYIFHRSTTSIQPNCYLQDLFTDEAARGKGVGRALINGVYEAAKRVGSPRVYLADPRDQLHGDAALRQGGREVGLRYVSKDVLRPTR